MEIRSLQYWSQLQRNMAQDVLKRSARPQENAAVGFGEAVNVNLSQEAREKSRAEAMRPIVEEKPAGDEKPRAAIRNSLDELELHRVRSWKNLARYHEMMADQMRRNVQMHTNGDPSVMARLTRSAL